MIIQYHHLCVFIVLQNYGLVKRGKNCINFTVPEVKILILLSCFIISGTLTLAYLGIVINETELLLDGIFKYIICQLGGYNLMCEDIRHQFEKYLHTELGVAVALSLGLLSWVYLLFAVQVQDIKRVLQGMATFCHAIARPLLLKTKSTPVKSTAIPKPVEP